MKGVTPIIAIILLLLITISMIGFAWIWFQRIGQSVANRTQTEVDTQTIMMGKRVRIDNVVPVMDNTSIIVRNIGSYEILPNELIFYIRDQKVECNPPISTIQPQNNAECIVRNNNCLGGSVKVTAPGNTDQVEC